MRVSQFLIPVDDLSIPMVTCGDPPWLENVPNSDLPSGKRTKFAIENDPVKIVDLPSYKMDENGDFPSFFVCLPGRVTTMTRGSHGDVMRCPPWTAKVKRLDRSRSRQAGFRRGQVPWGPWPSRKVMKTGDFTCVSGWWFGTAILNLHLWLGFSMAMLVITRW